MPLALRQLRRTPGFTAISVLTLALGIGTASAVFAIADAVDFTPIAGTRLDDVYSVVVSDRRIGRTDEIQVPDFETIQTHPASSLAAVASIGRGYDVSLVQIPGHAAHAEGVRISAGYADVFRLRAQIGRWISVTDNDGPDGRPVVVISDRLWRDWFGRRTDVVTGTTIAINHVPHQIVGVAPAGFQGNTLDYWRPMGHPVRLTQEQMVREKRVKQPGVVVVTRLAPGAAPAAAAAALSAAISTRPPGADMPSGTLGLVPYRSAMAEGLARMGYTLVGFGLLVFLAAWANVANLIYARTTSREGEFAVRLSLGATRFDIVGLLFVETAVIAMASVALGVLLAVAGLRLFSDAFPSFNASYIRRIHLDLSLNWRVFGVAAACGIAAALAGPLAVWRSSRASLLTRLASASQPMVSRPEGRTMRTLLVSVQVTAAVISLIAAGIFFENTARRFDERLMFDTGALVGAHVQLSSETNAADGAAYFDQLLDRVKGLPGVTQAAIADAMPGGSTPQPSGGASAVLAEPPARGLSRRPLRLDATWIRTSPGLVDTLGLRLLGGRDILTTDHAAATPIVLLSASAAARLWPGQDPIGKRIQCCGQRAWRTVIGIVPDPVTTTDAEGRASFGHVVFIPAAQDYQRDRLILARSATPLALVDALRQAIVSLDPSVAVFDVDLVDRTQFSLRAAERAARVTAATLGAIALAIALLGVYAVVSYFASRRTREFGLRIALGATRAQIVKLVVDHAIHMVLIGLLPGVLLASWGTRVFQAELTQLKPNGLTAWIAVPLLLLAAGVLAAFMPARRAAGIDPNRTLREL